MRSRLKLIAIGDKLSLKAFCQGGLGDRLRGGLARFGRVYLTIPKSRFSGAANKRWALQNISEVTNNSLMPTAIILDFGAERYLLGRVDRLCDRYLFFIFNIQSLTVMFGYVWWATSYL